MWRGTLRSVLERRSVRTGREGGERARGEDVPSNLDRRPTEMRIGCCAYSFRDRLTAGELSFVGFLDIAAEMGFEGVEITSYYVSDTSPEALRRLKRECFTRGLEITGVAVGTNFCQADDAKRAHDLDVTRAWAEHGERLGAPYIRVFAGPTPEGDTEESARLRCVRCIHEAMAVGEKHGLVVGLENHGGITANAEQVLKLVEAVGPSDWFGINFDSGNFHQPEVDFGPVAPHAVSVHAKKSYRDPSGEKRAIDQAMLRRALDAAGYRGFLNIEYEEPEDPMEGVPELLGALRAVFGG
jgi:sugar phosphate isomerase/epimerase